MDRFGHDKPDLRYGCEIFDATSWAADTTFRIFQQAEKVKGIVATGCGRYSRKEIDNLEAKAKEFGAGGLIWIKKSGEAFQSSILKAVGEEKVKAALESAACDGRGSHSVCRFAHATANSFLGQIRLHLARQEKWAQPGDFQIRMDSGFPIV